MERFAVFVDAGYLFAQAGELCCGTRDRRRLKLDHEAMASGLAQIAKAHSGLDHLRTYWYDGARDGRPSAQHISIGMLPTVKVRLGRLTTSGQKGVDSRLVRDLIILSQERSMSVAYLLGGDEDLREGVMEAQERGVRVVLLSMDPPGKQTLARTLTMEADDILTLDLAFLQERISLAPEEVKVEPPIPAPLSGPPAPIDIGREFGSLWAEAASPEAMSELLAQLPRIPGEIDRPLLRHGTERLGKAHLEDAEREVIRKGFWDALVIASEGAGAVS